MSKILYASLRHGSEFDFRELEEKIAGGASRLSPCWTGIRPLQVAREGRILSAIFNPGSSSVCDPRLVVVGHPVVHPDVRRVGGKPPELASAIVRSDGRVVELLSDPVASRTIWYYMDDSVFIASTSQRWIAAVIGGFEPNQSVLTWMLITGSLGPTDGWDRRVRRLQASSCLRVDLESWSTKLECQQEQFELTDQDEAGHERGLIEALSKTFAQLRFDYDRWVLPLSGGYDSRAILCLLQSSEDLRAITWGTAASTSKQRSDAVIAARLAKTVGVRHEFFATDPVPGCLPEVFERFVGFGEGRTASIGGYLDGFAIWRTLLAHGVEGIIRGDEAFGWKRVGSADEARWCVGLRLWEDFEELPERQEFDLPRQEIPDSLIKRNGETDSQWRDRLYQEYKIPTLLAALTDVKATFVEVANPLLSRSIIDVVRSMPDVLRTEKKLFKKVVDGLGPRIPYASERAIVHQDQFLRSREAGEFLLDFLASGAARSVLSESLLKLIRARVDWEKVSERPLTWPDSRRWLRAIARRTLKSGGGKRVRKPTADYNEMAFRAYIICKTHEIFREDARMSHANMQA